MIAAIIFIAACVASLVMGIYIGYAHDQDVTMVIDRWRNTAK